VFLIYSELKKKSNLQRFFVYTSDDYTKISPYFLDKHDNEVYLFDKYEKNVLIHNPDILVINVAVGKVFTPQTPIT
jgi:hypothetical protein